MTGKAFNSNRKTQTQRTPGIKVSSERNTLDTGMTAADGRGESSIGIGSMAAGMEGMDAGNGRCGS